MAKQRKTPPPVQQSEKLGKVAEKSEELRKAGKIRVPEDQAFYAPPSAQAGPQKPPTTPPAVPVSSKEDKEH